MRKRISLFVLCALAASGTCRAYDFSATTSSGHTLYFNIISAVAQSVEVTYPNASGGDYWGGYTRPTGNLVVDDTVVSEGITYHVDRIGDFVFAATNLTSVTLADRIAHIGTAAFQGCSMTSITLPSTLTTIGVSAFMYCQGLTTLTLPNSINSIGQTAFYDCTNLSSINIPLHITEIKSGTFSFCSSLDSITIPEAVHHIRANAFKGCSSLTYVHLPSELYAIEMNAFASCSSLTSITIPESVNTMQAGAFQDCIGLTAVHYNAAAIRSNTSQPFQNDTNIATVTFGDNVQIICRELFTGCYKITGITFPATLTSIGESAFQGCRGLTSIVIPDSVTNIGIGAFADCSGLGSVTLPSSLTTIKKSTFHGCSQLSDIAFPNTLTTIDDGAFCGCRSLTSVSLNENLASIGDSAFKGCGIAGMLLIPWRVTAIGGEGFMNCTGIEEITSRCMTAPAVGSRAFEGIDTGIAVNIPCGKLESYASRWAYFHNFHEMEVDLQVASDNPEQGSVVVDVAPSCSNHVATVRAVPNPGFRFDHWSNGDNHNPTSVLVIDSMALTAFFDIDTTTGITEAEVLPGIRAYAQDGRIVVEGAGSEPIRIYDITGRLIATAADSRPYRKGIYLVKVGPHPALKVVVL